jgi:hypothetical protein
MDLHFIFSFGSCSVITDSSSTISNAVALKIILSQFINPSVNESESISNSLSQDFSHYLLSSFRSPSLISALVAFHPICVEGCCRHLIATFHATRSSTCEVAGNFLLYG